MNKRNIVKIDDSWKFVKSAESEEDAVSKEGTPVTLPHTWNAIDGQDGGNDYYRGACWYVRTMKESDLPEGDEIWIEFRGAAMAAKVYLDGKCIAEHEGGFSAFRADLTGLVHQGSLLAVRVSNEESDHIYPQKADFTFYGGLYRDVVLIGVPKEHFCLNDHGAPGIRVTSDVDLTNQCATVHVTTWQNGGPVVISAAGQKKTVPSENGEARADFEIKDVHLWDGLADPYLYTAEADLPSGDHVATRFGCRVFAIDPQKGFFLNGRPYPLRGVSRHQDRKGKGNAISLDDMKEDMAIIRDLGANALRLAHYQHAQEFYDLCDENGLVVWAEIPYITLHMPKGRENTLSQMTELILQSANHPSIAVWGLSNEITAASMVTEDLLENHRQLNDLCHRLDPTRPTTMANVFMLETDSKILEIPDVSTYNLYFGWYVGELSQNEAFFDTYHAQYPNRAIGLSEFGTDANPSFHSADPDRGDCSEEYQCHYHEHMLQVMEERPYLWCAFVWNLFDFGADGRDEGGKHGENQKGLVTFDRKIKKDAFYLYKAAWSKEPFVHLCGRRYVDRAEEKTSIRVYSNQKHVSLFVDKKPFAEQDGDKVFVFSVPISGEHEITAVSGAVQDTIRIRKVDTPNPAYSLNSQPAAKNWFDEDEINPAYYSVMDTMGELRQCSQAAALLDQVGSGSNQGDVADAVKDNPNLQRMLARMKMLTLLKQAGIAPEKIKQLNRILQTIKKPEG